MATIKSYSDLQQSKKLAEILPLESADMCYLKRDINDTFIETPILKPEGGLWKSLSCWSLASLLGVLPEGYSFVLTKSFDGENYYCKLDGKPIETTAGNPVDACVAMIKKLHELKML